MARLDTEVAHLDTEVAHPDTEVVRRHDTEVARRHDIEIEADRLDRKDHLGNLEEALPRR